MLQMFILFSPMLTSVIVEEQHFIVIYMYIYIYVYYEAMFSVFVAVKQTNR